MLGIDTNVLVRYLVQDDQTQFEKARKLIKREVATGSKVFINLLVLMETEWVLRSRYAIPKNRILDVFAGLLEATDIQLEDEAVLEETLYTWKDTTADFADCLIGARNRRLNCRATATFDSKAAKLSNFIAA